MFKKSFVLFALFFIGISFCPDKEVKTSLTPPITFYYNPAMVLKGLDEFKEMDGELRKYADAEMANFEKRVKALEEKSKNAKGKDVTAEIAKEKNAIAIDQRAAQIEVQKRGQEMQMRVVDAMSRARETVAASNGFDVFKQYDPRMTFVSEKYDASQKIIDQMNKDFRAANAAKKFKKK